MYDLLKVEAKALSIHLKLLREKERHYLSNARFVSGKYPTKHQKGEDKPRIEPKQLETMLKLGEVKAADAALESYEKFWGIERFRKNVVRKVARDVHLALAFLRGVPALAVERTKRENPDWETVSNLILNESGDEDPRVVLQRFAEWKDAGNYPPPGKNRKKKEIPMSQRLN